MNRPSAPSQSPRLIRRDRHQPRGQGAALRVVLVSLQPGSYEGFLEDIITVRRPAESLGQAAHPGEMRTDEVDELIGSKFG